MTAYSFGSAREVWLAKLSAPATKWSFLIRDDAFTKSGQTFGRTVRLGDPLDTGNASGWQQLSWEGGSGQNLWSDQQMFQEGCADLNTTAGRARMWPGSEHIMSNNRKIEGFILMHGANGDGHNTPLWCGETAMHLGSLGNPNTLAPNPGGGWAMNRWDADTQSFSTVQFFDGPIMSIAPLNSDDGSDQYIHFTTQNGKYYMTKDDGTQHAAFQDTNALVYGFQSHSLVAFGGAMYYCQGSWLGKRVAIAPYGVTGTHSKVKDYKGARFTRGLAVWQNRLWFGVQYGGGKCTLHTSDGVTANQAAAWEEEFIIQNIVPHYGALYIAGFNPSSKTGTGTKAQVWKYTGSSLTKLWEEGDGRDGATHMASGLTTYGNCVVWTHDGHASIETEDQPWPNKRPGLMFYNSEKDALYEGPSIPMDSGASSVHFSDVISYNNGLAWAAYDPTSYSSSQPWSAIVAKVRDANKVQHSITPAWLHSRSFAGYTSTRSDRITSSEYSGPADVQAEQKVFLKCRVRSRIKSANAQIRVVAFLDGSLAETTVGTITRNPFFHDWSNNDFQMLAAGDYVQGTSIKYRLYLENTSGDPASTANAEVDAVSIKYMLVPTKQRQWRVRAVCQDGQLALDGSANTLTTAQAQADKLEELWGLRTPFNFYEPQASGGGPSGSPIVVVATDLNINQYRVDDQGSAVIQEVTMTLVEVV